MRSPLRTLRTAIPPSGLRVSKLLSYPTGFGRACELTAVDPLQRHGSDRGRLRCVAIGHILDGTETCRHSRRSCFDTPLSYAPAMPMGMTWGVPIEAEKALAWPVEQVALHLLHDFEQSDVKQHRHNFLVAAQQAYEQNGLTRGQATEVVRALAEAYDVLLRCGLLAAIPGEGDWLFVTREAKRVLENGERLLPDGRSDWGMSSSTPGSLHA